MTEICQFSHPMLILVGNRKNVCGIVFVTDYFEQTLPIRVVLK